MTGQGVASKVQHGRRDLRAGGVFPCLSWGVAQLLGVWAGLMVASVSPAPALACALHGNAPPVSAAFQGFAEASIERDARRPTGHVGLSYHGRVLRLGNDETGSARLREQTALLHAAGFLGRRVGVGVALPVARRELRLPNGEVQTLRGLGDMTLELRWRPLALRPTGVHLELSAGALLPTAPLVRGSDGAYSHPDVQLGAGVVTPRGSVAVVTPSQSGVRGVIAADALWAPTSPDGVQRAAIARVQPGVAWRVVEPLTLQVTTPVRHEGRSRSDGQRLRATGGTLGSVEPTVRWHLASSAHLEVGASVPLVQRLRGGQRERATIHGGFAWSFPSVGTSDDASTLGTTPLGMSLGR